MRKESRLYAILVVLVGVLMLPCAATGADALVTLNISDLSLCVTDASGNIVRRVKLDPFGNCSFTDMPVGTYRLIIVGGAATGGKPQSSRKPGSRPAGARRWHNPLGVYVTVNGVQTKPHILPRILDAGRIKGGGGALELAGYEYKNLITLAYKNSHDVALVSIRNSK